MSDERKPVEDLREGLSLLLRAVRTAAKQIDVAKIDKGLDRAVNQVGRVVSTVGRAVSDEINRMAASPPPWARGASTAAQEDQGDAPCGSADQDGHVWASQAQQSAPRHEPNASPGKAGDKPTPDP
ncbi:MAG: hypothetical protein MUF54_07870 [Polyangiaceae bacterium]|jgi:hypothetical protein|nr:hypothetical protein [Polyangiaceae bacterium]